MKKIILLLFITAAFCFPGFSQTGTSNSLVSETTALNNEPSHAEVKLYPNPVKNKKVTVEFDKLEIAEIKINNITGKEVFNQKFDYPENKKTVRLNDTPNGIYLIRIKTANDQLLVKKLIVANE